MSTSDKWTESHSDCPCGKGKIVIDVDSPDNPWSRTTRELRIACADCTKTWVIEYGELKNRAAVEASHKAFRRYYEADRALTGIGRDAIDSIVGDTKLADHKAEYKFLVAAGVCAEGPIRYPRRRAQGVSAGSMCNPVSKLDWITSNLKDERLIAELDRARKEKDQAELDQKVASEKLDALPTVNLL